MTKRNAKVINYFDMYKEHAKKKTDSMFCGSCGGKLTIEKSFKKVRCNVKKCRKYTSIFKNKLFYILELNVSEILKALKLIVMGASNKLVRAETGIGKSTITKIKKQFKSELHKIFWSKNNQIGGKEIILEADESKFGKRKYHRGHRVEGVWILGIVERSFSRKILYFIVKNRKMHTIDAIFKKFVKKGSIIHTDGWKGYLNLKNIDYVHKSVNHSLNFVDPLTGVNTNTIEGNWSTLKTKTPKRFRTEKWIGLYLLIEMIKRNYTDDVLAFYLSNIH